MPLIHVDQFCGLSTAPAWQAWLYRFRPELYRELADHLRTSRGCGHNREKMLELMAKIEAAPGGRQQLLEFLQQYYPHMVDVPQQRAAEPVRPQPRGVPFQGCDPRLLTFPRRAILQDPDPHRLHQKLQALLSGKARYDWVVVDDKVYVEFVPAEHARIAGQIPDKSWLVTRWKREHGR